MTATMMSIEDTAIKRLTEFASDVNRLADQRCDLQLRQLVDDLHRDLTRGDDDDE